MTEEYDSYRRAQARAWLEHVRRLGAEAERLQGLVESERAMLDGVRGIDYTVEHVSGTRGAPDTADLMDALSDRIRDYTAAIAAYTDERQRAARILEGVVDAASRRILTEHYLLGKTWSEVAELTDYSESGLMKLRRRALLQAFEVVPMEWRDPFHPASL